MYDELVKALRHCTNDLPCETESYRCKYADNYECSVQLRVDAADAIERLVAEIDRKDKAIQGLLDAVDKKNVKIDQWKRAWKTAYKLYESVKVPKESKGEQDGERAEQNQ